MDVDNSLFAVVRIIAEGKKIQGLFQLIIMVLLNMTPVELLKHLVIILAV